MAWINKSKCKKGMRLDIGSGNPGQGEVQPNGFVLNDVEKHPNIDLVCDIKDLMQFVPEGYCSEVRCSHILEHFGTQEVIGVVRIIHKLLEKDGRLTIFVPNFLWHVQLVLEDKDKEAIHYAFGGQLDQYDYHKTAFTPKLLKNLLEENGFRVETMVGQTSISCVAIKN
jgi:predicted SAM-dependent methyltransferase